MPLGEERPVTDYRGINTINTAMYLCIAVYIYIHNLIIFTLAARLLVSYSGTWNSVTYVAGLPQDTSLRQRLFPNKYYQVKFSSNTLEVNMHLINSNFSYRI